jgi:predicted nucleic acid-binding Zn ribbon protein
MRDQNTPQPAGRGAGDERPDAAGPAGADHAAGSDGAAVPRGADMARAALEAARARNAANRAAASAARRSGRVSSTSGQSRGTVAGRMTRRRWSGPGPDKARDPQPVGETIKSWLSSTGAAKELARAGLFDRWADIVGPEIADRCVPVSLVDGELVLQAQSTAWATQLRLLSGTIQQRINAQIGRGTVTRVRTKGPAGPSWRFGNRHVPGRGPRDTYG